MFGDHLSSKQVQSSILWLLNLKTPTGNQLPHAECLDEILIISIC